MKRKININEIINYWQKGAERSFDTAEFLYKGKRFSDCLFFCHLMLGKILKGLIAQKTKQHAPYMHELDILAKKTELPLTDLQLEQLKIISTFNIAARYDSIKESFYKRATKKYAEKYFYVSKELFLWLKKQYPRK
ncbi:MAG: HEPN domain-containing protein [bacterium]